MPPIFASNFGDSIGLLMGIGIGLLVTLMISMASLVAALRSQNPATGRWHAWFSLICAGACLAAIVVTLAAKRYPFCWGEWFLASIPTLFALGSLYIAWPERSQRGRDIADSEDASRKQKSPSQ